MQKRIMALAVASATASLCASAQQSPRQPAPLAPVIVTATPLGASELFDLVPPASALEGLGLRQRAQTTLGEALEGLPGISSSYFGPNSSRPVIRGLDGDRIQLLQNGVGVLDASAASADHNVAIEPISVDRIEVVRGPATLMYGGSAIGGVVNVIDARIPSESVGPRPVGAVDLRYGSNNGERAGGFRIGGGSDRFALHVDASRRTTQDLRIPGPQFSRQRRDELQASGQLAPGDDGPRGRLLNSASETESVGIGGSLLLGNRGYAGVSYGDYSSKYGTAAEPDLKIGMHQKRWEFASELRDLGGFARSLRTRFAVSDYQHTEYENTVPGTVFRNRGYDGRVELQHRPFGAVNGAFGLQVTSFRFSATGEEAFLPVSRTDRVAGFLYEEWTVTRSLKLTAGGRLENYRVRADDFLDSTGTPVVDANGTPLSAAQRTFNLRNGALGALYAIGSGWSLAANTTYSERGPNYQELFAFGPHHAFAAFEIGDRKLDRERSRGIDLGIRRRAEDGSMSLTSFYQRFSNYVALLPSGICYDEETRTPSGSSAPCNHDNHELEGFNFTPVRAVFRGFEADARRRLWGSGRNGLDLELRADLTRAENSDTNQPLPRISPLRYGGGLVYTQDRLGARVDVLHARPQNRVAANETTTDGYTRVDASVSWRTRIAGHSGEAFLRGVNLLNHDIRYATSFLKDVAPLGRRGIVVGYRANF